MEQCSAYSTLERISAYSTLERLNTLRHLLRTNAGYVTSRILSCGPFQNDFQRDVQRKSY